MATLKDQLAALDDGTVSLEQVLSFVERTVAEGDEGAGSAGSSGSSAGQGGAVGGGDGAGTGDSTGAGTGGDSDSRRAALQQTLDEWRRRSPVAASRYSQTIEQRIREAPAASTAAGTSGPEPTSGGPGPMSPPASPPTSGGEETVILARPIHGVGVGSVIKGRFRIVQELGEGGMGKVFKAVDQVAEDAKYRDPYVALKVLSEGFRQHPKAFQTLQRETAKARSLAHSNIVRVYDCDRDGDVIFMTMEYLPGQALDRLIKRQGFAGLPFSAAHGDTGSQPWTVMGIIEQAGRALAFAHRAGLVHSDFKPSNVFLTETGPQESRVKVIDFGIARAVKRRDPVEPERTVEQTSFDIEALRVMTPAYASPEMALEDHQSDPCDDIFALACVTYELISGRHPFARKAAIQAEREGLDAKRPPGLSRARWRALQHGLAFDRSRRTPSVERFLHELTRRTVPPAAVAAGLALCVAAAAVATVQIAPQLWQRIWPLPLEEQQAPLQASVAAELDRVSCAALEPTITDGVVRVGGFAGEDAAVAGLHQALGAIDGVQAVDLHPQRLDDKYCAVLDLVRLAGGNDGGSFSVAPARTTLVEGDSLTFTVKTPATPSYVYVDLYMPDGYVQHLYPPPGVQELSPADTTLELGHGGASGAWRIGSPFGTEVLVAFSAAEPLYDPYRWEVERADDYIPELKAVVERIRGRPGPVSLRADMAVLSTTAQ